MPLEPALLIVPSSAAAIELPRRLAQAGRALAGLYPFRLLDLARAIAEPKLLGSGLRPWDTGHDALIAARLLARGHALRLASDVPLRSVAGPLARTLSALRRAEVAPERLARIAQVGATPEDEARLQALADLYLRYEKEIQGRFADPATLFRAAREHLPGEHWLDGASALVVAPLELDQVEREFLAALARRIAVHAIDDPLPPGLAKGSFRSWAVRHDIAFLPAPDTPLAPLETAPPASLQRLRERLFEPPAGEGVKDGAVELLTAPGEAAEVRAIARRLLREAARGVPFEEMGIALAQPQTYAPLFTDLLPRLGIPVKLHPSLPLRFGRSARSLLLLFRCRELERAPVMEFLTFAPVPFAALLGGGETPPPAERWDAVSREARIVSGAERWKKGLSAYADDERTAAAKEMSDDRGQRRRERAREAESLLRVVELLDQTLSVLSGEASWPEWSERLAQVLAQWLAGEPDREAVLGVIADLAGLQHLEKRVAWDEVEHVLQSRFEWERLPLPPVEKGAVHAGALDAIAGLRFRVLAFPGLVEGGFPGVLRPDPLLLDRERAALARPDQPAARRTGRPEKRARQLSLFEGEPEDRAPADAPEEVLSLPTTQDLLLLARRQFHRACSQASEKLILSYPRADARSGRERLPSLFFVAAAQALEARPLGTLELFRLTSEDDLRAMPLELALDRGERDLVRVRQGGREAALQIAAGSRFFRQSHLASSARWSKDFTPYDGLVALSPKDGADSERARLLRERLDPMNARWPVSASRLALYSRCGFQYFLEHVLKVEPTLEPEERRKLEPLERGTLFHDVAERFLRELRDNALLPVRDSEAARARLFQIADEALERHVSGSPPRFTLLWERERRRFKETLLTWLTREAATAERSTPAYFEVAFGPATDAAAGEPHMQEPLEIELGDGRTLRVSGRIDRIDQRPDGALVLRDYKTGKAPRDEAGVFRGGKQLQIPFYVLAAAKLFPDRPVVEAFLDYVDGGRQVALELGAVRGESFRVLLRGLVDSIAAGIFLQEPSVCEWCDFKPVCGPRALIAQRRSYKLQDPKVQLALRLKSL